MYRRVLVPLDGSEAALAALTPARRLARLHGADVGLVTVVDPGPDLRAAEPVLNAGRAALEDPHAPCTVRAASDVASELARIGREEPDVLLCLTTRARGALGRAVFGSVAREFVRQADGAFVLVGPRCDVAADGDVRRLLVSVDGTPWGEAIMPWATRWSAATGIGLVLAQVVYPLVAPEARIPPAASQLDALGYVRRLARDLEQQGYRVMDMTVQHVSPPEALARLATDVPDSLLALAIPDPGLRADAFEGATAADIIRQSPVPVMVVRASSSFLPAPSSL